MHKTPIIELKNISKTFKRSNIYLKLESANTISHTFKDRGALSVIKQMKKEDKKIILAGTCSNMGVAISGMSAKYGVDSIIVVSSLAPISMINMIKKFSTKSIIIDGGFDEVDNFIQKISKKYPNIACVNTNFNKYFFKGFCSIIDELNYQLDRNKIYNIVVPTADGTLISALYKRYKKLSKKIDMPKIRFHIAQPTGCSPIVKAIKENKKIKPLKTINTDVIPLSVKNPLIYGKSAIKAVTKTNGFAFDIDEKDINKYHNLLTKKEGIYSDNVGGVLIGAIKELSKKIDSNETILGIYTGNGLVYSCKENDIKIASENEAIRKIEGMLR